MLTYWVLVSVRDLGVNVMGSPSCRGKGMGLCWTPLLSYRLSLKSYSNVMVVRMLSL